MKDLRCVAAKGRDIVVEGDAKTAQGTGGVGLHRSGRDAEQFGGLGYRQILQEPQHQDVTLTCGQPHQRLDYELPLADQISELIWLVRKLSVLIQRAFRGTTT
jgi:hypothetical protein